MSEGSAALNSELDCVQKKPLQFRLMPCYPVFELATEKSMMPDNKTDDFYQSQVSNKRSGTTEKICMLQNGYRKFVSLGASLSHEILSPSKTP